MSSARIKIWDQIVGYITWDVTKQTAIFEADNEYVESPINIAPILHREKGDLLYGNDYPEGFQGMIPTFKDSLPDSFGDVVFKEWLEQMNLSSSDMNPVERLLYIGNRGIGALEYEVGKDISNIDYNLDLEELSLISEKIIKRKYDEKDYLHSPEALESILNIGASVGGAQAKVLLALTKDDKLLAGDIIHDLDVDYYVVKLEHDPNNVWLKEKNYVEFVYNSIARSAGINVAESRLILEGGRAHFASKRFDRVNGKKVHKQTVSALAGFHGRNTEFSYENIFKMMEYLKLPYEDKKQLYMQMVFNVASSNRDDHTKNFAFLMNEKGDWSYSPAYDITYPFDPYSSFAVPHKISINNKLRSIDRNDLIAVAKVAGIRNFNEIINNVVDSISQFKNQINEYDLNLKTVDLISKDIEKNISLLR